MMKLISKGVLVAAVASLALAGSTTMSLAAKKKAAAAAPAACTPATWSASNCANGVCQASWCGADGKWYPGGWCWEPFCGTKR